MTFCCSGKTSEATFKKQKVDFRLMVPEDKSPKAGEVWQQAADAGS